MCVEAVPCSAPSEALAIQYDARWVEVVRTPEKARAQQLDPSVDDKRSSLARDTTAQREWAVAVAPRTPVAWVGICRAALECYTS